MFCFDYLIDVLTKNFPLCENLKVVNVRLKEQVKTSNMLEIAIR